MFFLTNLVYRGPIDEWCPDGYQPYGEGWTGLVPLRADFTKTGPCLMWRDDDKLPDRAIKLSDGLREPLSAAARTALENIGDRSISLSATTIQDALVELLTVNGRVDGSRFKPCGKPGRDGRCAISVGGQLIAEWWEAPQPATTQKGPELWPTTGTTLATGQTLTWTVEEDTLNVVSGTPNRLRQNNAGVGARARTSGGSVVDSNNNYVTVTCTNTAGIVIVGTRKANSATYDAYDVFWREIGGQEGRRLRVINAGSGTTMTDVPGSIGSATSVIICQANTDQITGSLNGVAITGATDGSVTTGVSCYVRMVSTNVTDAEVHGNLTHTDVGYAPGGGNHVPAKMAAYRRRKF